MSAAGFRFAGLANPRLIGIGAAHVLITHFFLASSAHLAQCPWIHVLYGLVFPPLEPLLPFLASLGSQFGFGQQFIADGRQDRGGSEAALVADGCAAARGDGLVRVGLDKVSRLELRPGQDLEAGVKIDHRGRQLREDRHVVLDHGAVRRQRPERLSQAGASLPVALPDWINPRASPPAGQR